MLIKYLARYLFLSRPSANVVLTDRDNQRSESLATSILGLDPGILSVLIVSVRNGSTLVEKTRSNLKNNFGSMSQRSNGMAGRWGTLAFNSMDRLEPVNSKGKYLLMVRQEYSVMIFPAFFSENVMLVLTIDPKAESNRIYQAVNDSLEEEIHIQ